MCKRSLIFTTFLGMVVARQSEPAIVASKCFDLAAVSMAESISCKYSDTSCLCQNSNFVQAFESCIAADITEGQMPESASLLAEICQLEVTDSVSQLSSQRNKRSTLLNPIEKAKAVTPYKKSTPKNRFLSTWFGLMLVFYFAAIMTIKTLFNILHHSTIKVLTFFDNTPCRKIRKLLLLPPLSHRGAKSRPLKLFSFSFLIPQRMDFAILVGFVALLIASLSAERVGNVGIDAIHGLGVRSGHIAISLMPLFFLFAGRNNILMYCTGWNMSTFSIYHKWIARMAVLVLIIHGASYAWVDLKNDNFSNRWKKPYQALGFVGFMCGAIICVQAMHWFRSRHYESFLIIHIVLALGFFILGYYHVKIILKGHYLEYYWICIAFWGFDRAMRLFRLLWSGNASGHLVYHESAGVVKMDITHANRWKFYPGAYAFIHFRGKKLWQSHPFTLYNGPDGKLKIAMRVMNGITEDIAKLCLESPKSEMTMKIGLEGPYGSKHKLSMYDTRIMIAGGIGITAVYGYAADVAKENNGKRNILLWVVRTQAMLDAFAEEIDYLRKNGVEVRLSITSQGTKLTDSPNMTEGEQSSSEEGDEKTVGLTAAAPSRDNSIFDDVVQLNKPNLEEIVSQEILKTNGPLAVLCCGPGTMNDVVRHTIVDNLESTKHRVDYLEDNFSW